MARLLIVVRRRPQQQPWPILDEAPWPDYRTWRLVQNQAALQAATGRRQVNRGRVILPFTAKEVPPAAPECAHPAMLVWQAAGAAARRRAILGRGRAFLTGAARVPDTTRPGAASVFWRAAAAAARQRRAVARGRVWLPGVIEAPPAVDLDRSLPAIVLWAGATSAARRRRDLGRGRAWRPMLPPAPVTERTWPMRVIVARAGGGRRGRIVRAGRAVDAATGAAAIVLPLSGAIGGGSPVASLSGGGPTATIGGGGPTATI